MKTDFQCRSYMTHSRIMKKDIINKKWQGKEYERLLIKIKWMKPGTEVEFEKMEKWVKQAVKDKLIEEWEVNKMTNEHMEYEERGKRQSTMTFETGDSMMETDNDSGFQVVQPRKRSKRVERN